MPTSSGGPWPNVPPEVPPPWRPGHPPHEPDPDPSPAPAVPLPADPPWRELLAPDVLDRLLAQRIVMVAGMLTEVAATRAAAALMTLNAEGDQPVTLHLNCPDGDLDAALALADTVRLMTVPVTADCRGRLGGPALAVLAAADRRRCSPHATFRFAEPRACLTGPAQQVDAQAAALRDRVGVLAACIAEATGRDPEQVAGDLRDGRVLDAPAAVAYGLVHELVRPAPRAADGTDPTRP